MAVVVSDSYGRSLLHLASGFNLTVTMKVLNSTSVTVCTSQDPEVIVSGMLQCLGHISAITLLFSSNAFAPVIYDDTMDKIRLHRYTLLSEIRGLTFWDSREILRFQMFL